jgi:tryptophanyl-tRNA synthetase
MSADILMFNADYVPVGSDQVQHVEIARDLAENFNNAFGKTIKLPEYMIPKVVQMLPGTDGRKMSKSYNNTIPLFAPREQLKKMISRVKTDSTLPTEPKSTDDSLLFMMYHELAEPSEVEDLRRRYQEGISWADVKQLVFEAMDKKFAEPREKFDALMADPATLDRILAEGKDRARAISTRIMADVRKATGIN